MKKNPGAAFFVLRVGLAFVLVWFACLQIGNPNQWTSFLPDFLKGMSIPATTFVLANAVFELVAATLLVLGLWTRLAAFLVAIHLFGIAFTIGFRPTGLRDMGLAIAALALAIGGAGMWSIDERARANGIPVA